MSKLLPVVFGAIIFAGLGVYDYVRVSREQASAAALGLTEPQGYIASLRARLTPAFAKAAPVALAAHLGATPSGWEAWSYDLAAGERLAGQRMQPAEALRSTTNDLLHRLWQSGPDTGRSVKTFQNEDALVVLSLAQGAPGPLVGVARAEYAALRGMPLALLEQVDLDAATGVSAPAPYRRLVADLGGRAELMVITNAGDAALVEVLATVDLPGLLEALGASVPGVSGDKPVVAGSAVIDTPLVRSLAEEEESIAQAEMPKGPCVRRGTVLSCE